MLTFFHRTLVREAIEYEGDIEGLSIPSFKPLSEPWEVGRAADRVPDNDVPPGLEDRRARTGLLLFHCRR